MRYELEDIETQLISTLQADAGLASVHVRTHAGEVTALTFLDPKEQEGFVHILPFVFVQYQGKSTAQSDKNSTALIYYHTLRFRFFVGAQTLSDKRGGQLTAYAMLRAVYDALHGKWANGNAQTRSPLLSGTQITTSGFNPLSPMLEAGGEDERLVVNLPTICVYQTDYTVKVVA